MGYYRRIACEDGREACGHLEIEDGAQQGNANGTVHGAEELSRGGCHSTYISGDSILHRDDESVTHQAHLNVLLFCFMSRQGLSDFLDHERTVLGEDLYNVG